MKKIMEWQIKEHRAIAEGVDFTIKQSKSLLTQ